MDILSKEMTRIHGISLSFGLAILFSLFLLALFLINVVPAFKDPKIPIGDKIVRALPLLIYIVFMVVVFVLFLSREG